MYAKVILDYAFNAISTKLIPYSASSEANVDNYDSVSTGQNAKGFQGFHLSADAVLNGTYKLYSSEGYPGWITSQICNASGQFSPVVDLSFVVQQEMPKYLLLRFDNVCNEYAVNFSVINVNTSDYINVTNNTKTFVIIDTLSLNLSAGNTLRLSISTWNKPNKNAKVTLFATKLTDTVINNLVSIESSENLFDSQLSISPGIVEQYANIVIYDKDKSIHQLAEYELLSENFPVTISLVNNGTEEIIGSFITNDWSIEGENSHVSLNCKDASLQFEKINFKSLQTSNRSIAQLLQEGFNTIKNVIWTYIDDDTRIYCENIYTLSSWCYTSTLKEFFNKVCATAQLRIYWYINKYIVARCY